MLTSFLYVGEVTNSTGLNPCLNWLKKFSDYKLVRGRDD